MASGDVVYETVLPDGADTYYREQGNSLRDKRPGTRAKGQDQPSKEEATKSVAERTVDAAPMATAVVAGAARKMPDNKVLIIGLLVIVAILVIAISVQVIKTRRAADEEKKAEAARQQAAERELAEAKHIMEEESSPPEPKKNVREIIADKLGAKSAARKMPDAKPGRSSLASYKAGRSAEDDRKKLETIVEDEATEIDPEQERMRETIKEELHASAAEDNEEIPMGEGTDLVVGADDDVRAEIARVNESKIDKAPARDETLIQPTDDEPTDADDVDSQITTICTAILTTGRRSGQECGRSCPNGSDRCKQHAKKAA
jgi:hypothetical protein